METDITRDILLTALPHKSKKDIIVGETVWLISSVDCIFFVSQLASSTNPLRKYTVWRYNNGETTQLSKDKQYSHRSGVHRRCRTEYTKMSGMDSYGGTSLLDLESGTDAKAKIIELEATIAFIRHNVLLLTDQPYIPNMQAFRNALFPNKEDLRNASLKHDI